MNPHLPCEIRHNILIHGTLGTLDYYCLTSKDVRMEQGPRLYAGLLWNHFKIRVSVAALTKEASRNESDLLQIINAVIMRLRLIYSKESERLGELSIAIDEIEFQRALKLMRFDDGRPDFNINYVSPYCQMTLLDSSMEVGFNTPLWTDPDLDSDSDDEDVLVEQRLHFIKNVLALGANPGKRAVPDFIQMLNMFALCLNNQEAQTCTQIIDLLIRYGAEMSWPCASLENLDNPASIIGAMLRGRPDVMKARTIRDQDNSQSGVCCKCRGPA